MVDDRIRPLRREAVQNLWKACEFAIRIPLVCTRLREIVEARMFAWILLYPDGETRAEISLGGHCTSLGDIELTLLLSTVDEARMLAEIS